jgi:uncharacterized protein (DUF486 family)
VSWAELDDGDIGETATARASASISGHRYPQVCALVSRASIGQETLPQLKITQEIITMMVFAGYVLLWTGEAIRWNYAAAAVCLVGAAIFIFRY